VSLRLRQSTRCATCGTSCRVAPLELMARGLKGSRGAWLWWQVVLCPPCQSGLRHQLGTPQLQELESGE